MSPESFEEAMATQPSRHRFKVFGGSYHDAGPPYAKFVFAKRSDIYCVLFYHYKFTPKSLQYALLTQAYQAEEKQYAEMMWSGEASEVPSENNQLTLN